MLTAGIGNLPRAVVLNLHCVEMDTQITNIGEMAMEKTTMSLNFTDLYRICYNGHVLTYEVTNVKKILSGQ